jgi:cytoskeleton protein RodZ
MTSMLPNRDERTNSEADLLGTNLCDASEETARMPSVSFADRLHTARETRGLTLETCALALKLPVRVLRELERGTCADIDSKIYLASYIGKYGRHLGINEASIQVELDRIKQTEPPLVATGGISHSRFLLDRYVTAATYVVLTAVIVVPMIWLGVRGTLDRDITHLAPLDAAPVAQQELRASTTLTGGTALAKLENGAPVAAPKAAPTPSVAPPVAPQEQPLLASMAPFPAMDSNASSAVLPVTAPAATGRVGSHTVDVSLSAPSWVEVVGEDGARLEYGLLPAGSNTSYHSDQSLDVRIGNATGAHISIDGQSVPLSDFRHANVAHFRVQVQDGKASPASL